MKKTFETADFTVQVDWNDEGDPTVWVTVNGTLDIYSALSLADLLVDELRGDA